MGDGKKQALRVSFDGRLKLEFHGAHITSDAGLLAYRELDEALELTARSGGLLDDWRTGKNTQHSLVALLRQFTSIRSSDRGGRAQGFCGYCRNEPLQSAVMNRPWLRIALALSVFAAIFITLTVTSYTQKSATWDEPQHLVAGYIAWKLHDYRLAPEHPPLLRMWAALPLLTMSDIKLATGSPYWLAGDDSRFCHQFLFQDNDADRLLFRARFMMVLLGVLLGILVFCWMRELFGFWPATVVLGLYCTEPNLLAHSSLVTTDLGTVCFIFGAVYFAWRTARNFSAPNLSGLAVFFALAQASKYSALLLAPVLFALLLARALSAAPWPCAIGKSRLLKARERKVASVFLLVGGLLAVSYVGLWAVYGFRYAPSMGGIEQGHFIMSDEAPRRLPGLTRFMEWVDNHHLLPNACAKGFTSVAATAQQRQAYLLGKFSNRGWWYYFPLAFLIKTPIALLCMTFIGLALWAVGWKTMGHDMLFVIGPIVVYFGAAVTGHLNIGLRHVLPIYPFVLLIAGKAVAALGSAKSPLLRGLLGALCLFAVVESAAIYPDYLAFFNQFIGGPRNGQKYLVESNLDWGQDLKGLKLWMDQNNVQHINLSYFGTADPAYYKINCTHLPGAPLFAEQLVKSPTLPGFVAVSATNLRGVYFDDRWRNFYWPLLEMKPAGVIGYSIYVYWVERRWWP
jgi:hypothetical protein